ncbi:MAG: NADH-quinone oxidoreductase subunit N [Myxococcales bacterium]|nr:NADH-quinone oxidoreductase subunit N [Myxococcales bacterium]
MLHDLALLTPLFVVLLAALFTLVADPFLPAHGTSLPALSTSRRFWGPFNAAACLGALAVAALLWKTGPHEMRTVAFALHISASKLSLFFVALVCLCGAVAHLTSPRYLEEQGMAYGEYYALVSFAVFGMGAMVSAESLLTMFLSLEIMSLSVYVLVAFKRSSAASVEAGMKYFIVGSVASAVFLYGAAFLFGLSGGTTFVEIQRALQNPRPGDDLWLSLGVTLVAAAFLVKVAAVPFHMWAPDAYEGAPTPITGFMSAGVKAVAFAAFLKVVYGALQGPGAALLHVPLPKVLATTAVITMTVGNLFALTQLSAKRMLAYSAVAHAGYLLLGMVAASPDATLSGFLTPGAAVPFYLLGYALASLAAFAALTALGHAGEELTGPTQLLGLGRRHPLAGAVLALSMISLAGVPPTLGFFGKLVLIREVLAVDGGAYLPHIVILVLNSVVSAYYYLRITVHIYMRPEGKRTDGKNGEHVYIRETGLTWAMGATAAAILVLGALPERAIGVATRSAASVRTRAATLHVANQAQARLAHRK